MIVLTNVGKAKLYELGLTTQQVRVCEKMLVHQDSQGIADSLFVCRKTIRCHLTNIYKLIPDVHSNCGLLLFLFEYCAVKVNNLQGIEDVNKNSDM
jgi:DNA-binding NarL/FixJ family response regulator